MEIKPEDMSLDSDREAVEQEIEETEAPKDTGTAAIPAEAMDGNLPGGRDTPPKDGGLSYIGVTYNLTGPEVVKALKFFQRKVLLRRNIIFTILIAVAMANYIWTLIAGRDQIWFSVVFLLICVSTLLLIWYTPLRHRKKMAEIVGGEDHHYTIDFYETFAFVPQSEDKGLQLDYGNKSLFAAEDENLFIIGVGKTQVFAVPKRCMSERDVKTVHKQMADGFEERFSWIGTEAMAGN